MLHLGIPCSATLIVNSNYIPFQFMQDHFDDINMTKMDEARIRYLAALAVAKENPGEESLPIAAEARQRL